MNQISNILFDLIVLPARLFVGFIRVIYFIGFSVAWKFMTVGSRPYQLVRSLVRSQNTKPGAIQPQHVSKKEQLFIHLFEPTLIELAIQKYFAPRRGGTFAIHIPLNPNNLRDLERSVKSLKNQSYSRWIAIFRIPPSITPAQKKFIRAVISAHLRPEQYRILTEFSFDGLQTYCLYLTCGDVLRGDCLHRLAGQTQSDLLSFDILQYDQQGEPHPFCRPPGNSPELLISIDYLSHSAIHFSTIRTLLERKLIFAEECQQDDYAILLNIIHQMKCSHQHLSIPLYSEYYCREHTGNWDAHATELRKVYASNGIQGVTAELSADGQPHISWPVDGRLVSIIIPSRDKPDLIRTCVESIYQFTDYPAFEIIIVDNGSTDPAVLAAYQQWQSTRRVRVVDYNQEFNYSRAINLGAAEAKGQYLLFLNNDIRIFRSDWLRELVQWAMLPDVGFVGAQLLYPDETIQHSGVVFDPNRLISHVFCHQARHNTGPHGSSDWYRNYVGVTGACQMVRTELFRQVGGYDEKYELSFSDIEICLKMSTMGYRTVYNPFVVAYHHESATRKDNNPTADIKRAIVQFSRITQFVDPFYSSELVDSFSPRFRKMEPRRDRIIRLRLGRKFS